MELMRTRMAIREMSKYTLKQICQKTYAKEGVLGFYKGSRPALLGIVIYKGLGFSSYEFIYKFLSHVHVNEARLNFVSGAAAGLFAQVGIYLTLLIYFLVSYPLDILKKRAQVSSNFIEIEANPQKKLNLIILTKTIFKDEGFRGFYKGITLNFFKVGFCFIGVFRVL